MTTIVNSPPASNDSSGGMAMIFGTIALVVVAYLFFVYGLPSIRNAVSPQVNIPSKIDVNVVAPK